MINYDDVPHEIRQSVSVTKFRRHMAHYVAMVRYGNDWVCIKRRGARPVFLVSQADFDLIRERFADLREGPRDAKGHRTGYGFLYWLRELMKAKGDPRKEAEVEDLMRVNGFGGGDG